MKRNHLVLGTTCLTTLLLAGAASAGGLDTPNVGPAESSPVSLSPAAVYWNPGMLGFLEEPALLVGGDLVLGHVSYTRNRRATYQRSDSLDFALPLDAADIDASKTGEAPEATANPVVVQPTVFLAVPISDTGLALGFGIYAPYGAQAEYPEDGAQRWQLQRANIATVNFTPTLSFRFNEHVAIGAGASYVLGFAEQAKIQDFAALDDVGRAISNPPISQDNDFGADAPPGVRELDTMARPVVIREALAKAWTFHFGVAVRPTEDTRFGVTYQHKVDMEFEGKFTLDMDDDYFTQDLAAQGLQFPARVRGDATIAFPLPSALMFGIGFDVDELSVDLSVRYAFWSMVERFDVTLSSPELAQPDVGLGPESKVALPRDWKDTYDLTAIFSLPLSRSVRLGWHLGYMSGASPDATIDASSPDGDRLVLGATLDLGVSDAFHLITDLELQRVDTREVTASAYDLANGTYDLLLFTAGLHGQFVF